MRSLPHDEEDHPASSLDAYVAALSDWQRATVEQLRAAALGSAALDEVIKWGHLVYLSNGPVLPIRAEESRVLFGPLARAAPARDGPAAKSRRQI
jgi:hypothetical protein